VVKYKSMYFKIKKNKPTRCEMHASTIHSKQYTLSETETIEPKVQRRSWSKSRGARNAAGRSNHRPMVRGERGQRVASMSQDLPLGAARASMMSHDRSPELHLLQSQDLPLVELRLQLFRTRRARRGHLARKTLQPFPTLLLV